MREKIKKILRDFKSGKIETEEVLDKLKSLPFEDLDFAKIDTHRSLRKGFPETIFCQRKTIPQILKILEATSRHHHNILGTRADKEVYNAVRKVYKNVEYNEIAKTLVINKEKVKLKRGKILILTAGTADIPVAEEAAVTAQIMGNKVDKVYDVGVAGIHRLLANKEKIFKANVIIVVAGMEGALPGVVGGLASRPVIAVPTSVGYGASFKGLSPLLTMLNTCSPGVAVVNIDNGFGAGYFASLINR
ncbi:MAG: nickel pincer cofactor biosynthesis protein LarB [Candidatus Aerophobetes bacterium]|nr:nickel pincer cofactor biosynthesis protein LarB [Candidatus Aerophobetes bacterium]